jgi:hypothetical protein
MNKFFMVMRDGNRWVIYDTIARVKYWGFKNYKEAVVRCMELNAN